MSGKGKPQEQHLDLVQVIFRLPAQLAEQCMLYNAEEGRYEPLEPPQALIAQQLAMLLPAAVAMQARTSSQVLSIPRSLKVPAAF